MTEAYEQGRAWRRRVIGDDYADASEAKAMADDASDEAVTAHVLSRYWFSSTEHSWGSTWLRPGLDLRSRSIATMTSFLVFGLLDQVQLHIDGALRNELLTGDEIAEVLVQAAAMAGFPAALDNLKPTGSNP